MTEIVIAGVVPYQPQFGRRQYPLTRRFFVPCSADNGVGVGPALFHSPTKERRK